MYYLETILIGIAAVIASYFLGSKRGKNQEKLNQSIDTLKQIKEARDVETEVNKMDDDTLRNTASKWLRK